jgi:hypothetical protein
MNVTSVMQSTNQLAKTGDEYVKLLGSKADWIVRSKEDFTALRQSGKGPMCKLTEADFAAFIGSLKFNGGGVAHCNYKPLMGTLALTEVFQVFGYMGMAPAYVMEAVEHSCIRDICTDELHSMCASTCHAM